MSINPAWTLLGIAPTEDQGAIRKAYANKLKTIDADRDPGAFIALREAFESARFEAQWVQLPDEPDSVAEDIEPVEAITAPEAIVPAPAEPMAPEPEAAAESLAPPSPWVSDTARIDEHARALADLLYDAGNRLATQEETTAMLAHWREIVADPRMQQVAHFGDTEQWVAQVLAQTMPASDPLVIPAAELFHWPEHEGTIHQPPVVAALLRRYRALQFAEAMRQRSHRLHDAWIELTTPAGLDAERGRVQVRKIHALLRMAEHDFPELWPYLDQSRIGLWQAPVRTSLDVTAPYLPSAGLPAGRVVSRSSAAEPRMPSLRAVLIVGLVAVVLYLGLFALASQIPPSVERHGDGNQTALFPVPDYELPLSKPVADIDRALQDKFGEELDVATVQIDNPALFARLEAQWNASSDAEESLTDFSNKVSGIADRWYYNGVRSGSVELVSDYQRLSIDMAKALNAKGAGKCAKFLKGDRLWEEALGLDAAFRERERKLMARALIETQGEWRDYPAATIPHEVIVRASLRSRISEAAIGNWIDGRSAADDCATSIAMFEAVLEQPAKVRLPILRVL